MRGEPGPPGPAGSAGLPVVAANGNPFAVLLSFEPGGPSRVALQRNGVWLQAQMSYDGTLYQMSTNALFLTPDCSGQAYLPLDTNPVPLLRSLLVPGGSTAYYAGAPAAEQSFASMAPLDGSGPCTTTENTGWAGSLLAGPLGAIDMQTFPAPFRIQ